MFHLLHTYHPDRILLSLGPVNIYWYGFLVVLGIVAAILVALKLASFYKIKKEVIIDLTFWLLLAGVIGARIYYFFLELPYYLKYPLDIFKLWQGGLAIHGAILFGLIALLVFCKKYKHNFWQLSSVTVVGLALGQAIGRWGNYFNQELFGKPTDLAWGIPIDFLNRPFAYLNYQYFHPTFLYESLGNFLIFLILISFHVYIIKKVTSHELPASPAGGRATCYVLHVTCYLVLYSVLRFSIEFIRLDNPTIALNLNWPQWISLLIILVSLITALLFFKKHDKNNKALT